MKVKTIYFLLIIILSSCGASKNFNRQKFTTLKKVKSTVVVQTENEIDSETNEHFYEPEESPIETYSVSETEIETIDAEAV